MASSVGRGLFSRICNTAFAIKNFTLTLLRLAFMGLAGAPPWDIRRWPFLLRGR